MNYTDLITYLRDSAEVLAGSEGKLLMAAAEAMRELSKPQWISVKDRLPDTMRDKSADSGWSDEYAPTDDVLCYIAEEERLTVAWYSYTFDDWTTVDELMTYRYGEITHWMPLPEPPKEDNYGNS